MSPDRDGGDGRGGDRRDNRRRPTAIYSAIVGLVFIAIIAVAGINTLKTDDSGVLGARDEGDLPLAQFAVPDARGDLDGDANIAQDDCEVSRVPCPEGDRRSPACAIQVEGAIRVCDLFDKPLVMSFWFTKGGDCESQQDVFEAAYRRYRDRANFLSIDVRDDREEVLQLAQQHGWTHPIGLDSDGALSNLYRVGGCPTFIYAFPGGILHGTSIGELDVADFDAKVADLLRASKERDATVR